MADFCNGCEDTVLGVDEDKRTTYSKDTTEILCEGCGVWMIVDKNGHSLVENDDHPWTAYWNYRRGR